MKNKISDNKIIYGIVAIIVVVISYFVLYGNKKLICTYTQQSNGIEVAGKFDMRFTGKKLKKFTTYIDVDLGQYASYRDMFISQIKTSLKIDELEKKGGKVDIKNTDNKVKITVSASRSGMSAITSSDESSYKEVKAKFEEMGYVCK